MFDLEFTFISRKSKDCGKSEQNILTDGDGSSEDKHNVVGSARSLVCPSPPSGASFSQQLKSKRRISKALWTKVSGTKKDRSSFARLSCGADFWPSVTCEEQKG